MFAGGPTFTRCEQYGWKYLITLQEGDLPSVHQDFEALTQLAPEKRLHFTPSSYPPVTQDFRWMNDLPYVDTAQQAHRLAVIDCLETAPQVGGQAVLGRQNILPTPWLTERHGYDPT